MSTNAHTSCRCVAAAKAANNTLVRPEEAGPQISVRHPRGRPPVSASSSRTPLETISGVGRISSRDAAVTPASLGTADRRLKTNADHSEAAMATGRPAAAVETGEDDIETSDFREHQSRGRLLANYRIRLLFAIGLFYRRAGLSSVLKLIATQDSRKLAMKNVPVKTQILISDIRRAETASNASIPMLCYNQHLLEGAIV
jgi:hypothetical protein